MVNKKRSPGRPRKGDMVCPIILEALGNFRMINANALSKFIHETRGIYFHEKTVRYYATKLSELGLIEIEKISGHIYFGAKKKG